MKKEDIVHKCTIDSGVHLWIVYVATSTTAVIIFCWAILLERLSYRRTRLLRI